jgi:3-phosphoglycerate kinase
MASQPQHKKKTVVVRKKPPTIVSKPKRQITVARRPRDGEDVGAMHATNFGSSVPAGPRADETGRMIDRSYLGEEEDYLVEEALWNTGDAGSEHMSLAESMARPPSMRSMGGSTAAGSVVGTIRDKYRSAVEVAKGRQAEADEFDQQDEADFLSELPISEKLQTEREKRALVRWQKAQKDWKTFQRNISRKLGKREDDLVMVRSEEYRLQMEEYDMIHKATPVYERHGPAYWLMSLRDEGTQYVPVGNIFSGLFCPIKNNPKPQGLQVRRPGKVPDAPLVKDSETGEMRPMRTWQDSGPLQKRKRELGRQLRELRPHDLQAEASAGLHIIGQDLIQWAANSSDAFFEKEEARISRDEQQDAKGDYWADVDGDGDLDLVRADPDAEVGPKMEMWMQGAGEPSGSSPGVDNRLFFEGTIGKEVQSSLEVRNPGDTALYLRWRKVPNEAPIDVGSESAGGDIQRFFCHSADIPLLPGEIKTIVFSCKTEMEGVFYEKWQLTTTPSLPTAIPQVTLRAAIVRADGNVMARRGLETAVQHNLVLTSIKALVREICNDACDAAVKDEIAKDTTIDERATFIETNAELGLEYSPALFQSFNEIAVKVAEMQKQQNPWDGSAQTLQDELNAVIVPAKPAKPDGLDEAASAEWEANEAEVEAKKASKIKAHLVEEETAYLVEKQGKFKPAELEARVQERLAAIAEKEETALANSDIASALLSELDVLVAQASLRPLDDVTQAARSSLLDILSEIPLMVAEVKEEVSDGSVYGRSESDVESRAPIRGAKEERYREQLHERVADAFGQAVQNWVEITETADKDKRVDRLKRIGLDLGGKLTLDEARGQVDGKTVLLTTDLDVSDELEPAEDHRSWMMPNEPTQRLRTAARTIQKLLDSNVGRIIIVSKLTKIDMPPLPPPPKADSDEDGSGSGSDEEDDEKKEKEKVVVEPVGLPPVDTDMTPVAVSLGALLNTGVEVCDNAFDLQHHIEEDPEARVLLLNGLDQVWAYEIEAATRKQAHAEVAIAKKKYEKDWVDEGKEIEELEPFVAPKLPPILPTETLDMILPIVVDVLVQDDVAACVDKRRCFADLEPSTGLVVPGVTLQEEMSWYQRTIDDPIRPLLAVVGGSGLTSKLKLIDSLLDVVDEMIISGDLAFTFMHEQGKNVGASPVDTLAAPLVRRLLQKASHKAVKLHLPIDYIVGDVAVGEPPKKKEKHKKKDSAVDGEGAAAGDDEEESEEDEDEDEEEEEEEEEDEEDEDEDEDNEGMEVDKEEVDHTKVYRGQLGVATVEAGIPDDWLGMDIGEASVQKFKGVISRSKTVIWNSVLGKVECDSFQAGTREVMDAMIVGTDAKKLKSFVVGSDSADCIKQFSATLTDVSYISKSEDCSLAVLAGKAAPGVARLVQR